MPVDNMPWEFAVVVAVVATALFLSLPYLQRIIACRGKK